MLTFEEVSARLLAAGILALEFAAEGTVRDFRDVGLTAGSATQEEGRIDPDPDDVTGRWEPDFAGKVNESWFRVASRHGLFGEDGEFLIVVNLDLEESEFQPQWVRVRLMEEWDIVASQVRLLGFTSKSGFVPDFRALATDGSMLVDVVAWGDGTVGPVVVMNRESSARSTLDSAGPS